MGAGAVLEPLVVVVLLFGGAWINRETSLPIRRKSYLRSDSFPPNRQSIDTSRRSSDSVLNSPTSKTGLLDDDDVERRPTSPSLLAQEQERWHTRTVHLFGVKKEIVSPNTARFRNRFLSRVLRKFPFLAECWYWALVYWTYQLGRAFTAVTLSEDTVDVARRHALQLIAIEQRLGIFWERSIQEFFMSYPSLMQWINWLYSFVHIPGTIAFLVWLYYYTITRNRLEERQPGKAPGETDGSPAGPALYQARRRTMAVCNLLAFIVFTLWPCMPPRLLNDPNVPGEEGKLARSFGFVDTVHGKEGAGSVWTQNKFCNQYAAMPSLHFGYSLMIGLTIMSIPLPPQHRRSKSVILPFFNRSHPSLAPKIKLPSVRRMICVFLGFLYPFAILVAIISTANHFILDAVAGAIVCCLGWRWNDILLNLLPLEDYFLWLVRIHKPEPLVVEFQAWEEDEEDRITARGVLTQ